MSVQADVRAGDCPAPIVYSKSSLYCTQETLIPVWQLAVFW